MSKTSFHDYRIALSVADDPNHHTINSCKRALGELKGYNTQRAQSAIETLENHIKQKGN